MHNVSITVSYIEIIYIAHKRSSLPSSYSFILSLLSPAPTHLFEEELMIVFQLFHRQLVRGQLPVTQLQVGYSQRQMSRQAVYGPQLVNGQLAAHRPRVRV